MIVTYNYPGTDIKMSTYTIDKAGYVHSIDDHPSSQTFRRDGVLQKQLWHHHKQLHRIAGPASIKYNKKGDVMKQSYYYFDDCIDDLIENGTIIVSLDGSLPPDSIFTIEMLRESRNT